MKHRLIPLLTATLLCSLPAQASSVDSLRCQSWGFEVGALPGWVIATDPYERKWLHDRFTFSLDAAVRHTALPEDSDAFAAAYDYPTLKAGIKYSFNRGVTMQRHQDPDWGLLVPVDYTSRMGNIITAYGTFERPLLRRRHWQADYTLSFGIGYAESKYNTTNAIDNELIGSHWLIYFGTGLHLTYFPSTDWGIRGGLDFYHHSNGALYRPNKGANIVGPSLALVYSPAHRLLADAPRHWQKAPFSKVLFTEVAVGIGAKTLDEEWQRTQFQTPADSPDYRTDHFRVYIAYSAQLNMMYRYARRWASGVGLDIFYGTYAHRVATLEQLQGSSTSPSPWSVGVAAKHRVYYHNLSLDMSLGYYLYRHMGTHAAAVETPYYERIGLHYRFAALRGLTVGVDVKAHKTKADYTELILSYPIRWQKHK